MSDCIHHYYLGQASNGVIPARCQKCGAEEYFPSRLTDSLAKNKTRWTASVIMKKTDPIESKTREITASYLKLKC